jgi:predicted NUDIX family phosphoesterase
MPQKKEENVLVVSRTLFQPDWIGLNTDLKQTRQLLRTLRKDPNFLPRYSVAELTEDYLQIIPWFCYSNDGQLFVMQRSTGGGETELHHQYVLGFGGHTLPQDILHPQYAEWGGRELRNEAMITGRVTKKPLGMIYHDQKPVERRHLGIAYQILGSGGIGLNLISEGGIEYSSGEMMTQDQIRKIQLDSWSQSVFEHLISQPIAGRIK